MKKIFVIIALFAMCSTQAQVKLKSSPFHHIPPPESIILNLAPFNMSLPSQAYIKAYRFVLPFSGYSITTKQISTGIGYGWNKMHLDSTKHYYVDLSIFGALFVNSNVGIPTPYNYTSVGVGVGLLNGLVMIIPSYNLPTADKHGGAFDLKVSLGIIPK